MSDTYLQNLMSGGYVGGNYYSGADPSSYVTPLILASMQNNQSPATDTFQYFQSMFSRVQNAQGSGGGAGTEYPAGTLSGAVLGSTMPGGTSAASATTGAVGSWVVNQIMTPRFIVFAIGGVLIIVALFSLAKPMLGIAEQGVSVAQRIKALKGGE